MKSGLGCLAVVALERGCASYGQTRVHVPAVDLVGLGVKFEGHQTEALGAAQVKTAPGDPEAIFSLATKEVRSDHGF